MPNIVVEGPDGAGKTTLMETLRATAGKRYFVMMRHSCRPYTSADAMRFYDILRGVNQELTVLIDRHPCISEPIYGPILRGHDLLEKISRERLLEMIEQSCSRIIYCRPPERVIRENLSKQPQLAGVFEKIGRLIDTYDRAMHAIGSRTGIPIITYDWTNPEHNVDLNKRIFGS